MPQQNFDFGSVTTGQYEPGKPMPVQVPLARRDDPKSSHVAAKQYADCGALESHSETIVYLMMRAEKLGGIDITQYELESDMQYVADSLQLDHHQIVKRFAGLEDEEGLT